MIILGLIPRQITTGLLQSKIDAATVEIDNARQTVQNSSSGADLTPTAARAAATGADRDRSRWTGPRVRRTQLPGYSSVIVLWIDRRQSPSFRAAGRRPGRAALLVAQGQVAYQYTTIRRDDQAIPALVMGAPARTSTDFEVLDFAAGEQGTVVVQRTLLLGGSRPSRADRHLPGRQVVAGPPRAAPAGRFGDLAERMPVKGRPTDPDPGLFNGMAEAIRVQIRQLEEFATSAGSPPTSRTSCGPSRTTVRMAADMLYDKWSIPPEHPLVHRAVEYGLDQFESLARWTREISRYDVGMAELSAETIDIRSCIHAASPRAARQPISSRSRSRMISPGDPVVAEIGTPPEHQISRNPINAIDHADRSSVEVQPSPSPRCW